MDEVAFQDFERGCVTEKEPTHLPLGCSIKRLVKVSKTFPSLPLGDLLTLSSFNKSPFLSENSGSVLKAKN